jgi:diguanylate cyclase (GGDEF)-like protein/PAS domain S-box-containing protein
MGLIIHTRQGIIFANQEASRLLRVGQDQAIGRHFLDFLSANVDDAEAQMEEAFTGTTLGRHSEIQFGDPEQGEVVIKLIAGPLPWEGNTVVQLLLQDITDLKRTEATLRRLTVTDELTGAFNRRHAFATGAVMFEKAQGSSKVFSVVALDIDHFKRINDNYGHAVGDIALKKLADVVADLVSHHAPSAVFSRIGGEEFTLALPEFGGAEAYALAEILRDRLARTLMSNANGHFGMTISMGIASLADVDLGFASLLGRADEALYAAKAAGRNRVTLASLIASPATLKVELR